MKEDIKSMYRYFLIKDYTWIDGKNVINFVLNNTDINGRFFCWHKWRQFEVTPEGWNIFISGVRARCSKCGKVSDSSHRAEADHVLTNVHRHVSYWG